MVRSFGPARPSICVASSDSPRERLKLVRCAQRNRAQRRSVHLEVALGQRVGFSVEDQVDMTLLEQGDLFSAMPTCRSKTELLQPRAELPAGVRIDCEFKKSRSVEPWQLRRLEEVQVRQRSVADCGHRGLLEVAQRTHRVDRGLPGIQHPTRPDRMRMLRCAADSASARSCAAARSASGSVCELTFEHTSSIGAASSTITSNFFGRGPDCGGTARPARPPDRGMAGTGRC